MTTIVDIEFRAFGNFSQLTSAVAAANAKIQSLQLNSANISKQSVANATTALQQSLVASGQFTVHQVQMTSAAEKFGQALNKQNLSLAEYRGHMKEFRQEQRGFISQNASMVSQLAQQQARLNRGTLLTTGRDATGKIQATAAIPTVNPVDKGFISETQLMRQRIMNNLIRDGSTALINYGKNTQWAGRQLSVGRT